MSGWADEGFTILTCASAERGLAAVPGWEVTALSEQWKRTGSGFGNTRRGAMRARGARFAIASKLDCDIKRKVMISIMRIPLVFTICFQAICKVPSEH